MVEPTEALRRKEELQKELEGDISSENVWAHACRSTSDLLMLLVLAATGAIAFGGLTGVLSGKATGAIALIAGFIILFARTYKFQEKAALHYRKRNRSIDLRDQLIFQQPESPTVENIAAISKKRIALLHMTQEEWEKELSLDWSRPPLINPKNPSQLGP